MRCTGCGQSLWNLPGRTCPECGKPFRPSEFEFRPNAVEFCCGQCGQQYYGTDASGLPEPRAFACVRCGARCELDAMVLRLAPGIRADEVERFRVPWERDDRGALRRFFSTVGAGIGRPRELGKAVARGTEPRRATWFAAWMLVATTLPTAVLALAFMVALPMIVPGGGAPNSRYGVFATRDALVDGVAGAVLWISVGVGTAVAGMLALAGLSMVLLRVLGAPARWRVAWPAFAYSLGPAAFLAVPYLGACCLPIPVAIWYVAVVVTVLTEALVVPRWKAACACIGAAVVLLAVAVGGVWAFESLRTRSVPAPVTSPAPDAARKEPSAPDPGTDPEEGTP